MKQEIVDALTNKVETLLNNISGTNYEIENLTVREVNEIQNLFEQTLTVLYNNGQTTVDPNSGEVDTEDREAIRRIVETQKDAVIVASMGTFSTGINIRNLHNIVFASPSKSQIKVLQSIGRGLRKSDDGSTTKLFDIADDLHWRTHKNFTLLHCFERVKIYKKEQFNFSIKQVNIE